jgi:hypothetical protein
MSEEPSVQYTLRSNNERFHELSIIFAVFLENRKEFKTIHLRFQHRLAA